MNKSLFYLLLSFSLLINETRAHGYLASPRSRNFVANQDGLYEKREGVPEVPYVEYCHACLTRNAGVCGLSIHNRNYDDWLDSVGSPMPWISQATYEQGGIIRINTIIKAHHWGHIEMSACPEGRASTQDCFDQHRLTFVQDVAHGMPSDPKHPERGYLSLGEEFAMDFMLPDDVSGENVLLQWRYVSANSCNPIDYPDYFGGSNSDNEILPEEFWNSQLRFCNYPLPLDGSRGFLKPEQFFNCAEITVLPSSTTSVETARPEIAPVTQETNLETESTESNPVEPSSLIQELISRIDSPATKEVATVGPVAQETASPVASPIVQQTTSSPVMRETSHPTMSPTVQETTSPTIPVETTISTNSPVYTVPSENDVLDNIDAESGDLVEVVETAPINSHNAIEDDKLTSIIEGSENSVQVSPLEESDSAGSRSLSSLLVLSLVLIIQQFW